MQEGNPAISFRDYGVSFQEKIMQALLIDNKWAEQMSEVIEIDYFDVKYLRYLVDKYFKYHEKYRAFPSLSLLVSVIRDDLKTGTDTILRDTIIEFLQKTKAGPDLGDIEYVKEKSLDFCKKQKMREALLQAVDLINAGNDENVLTLIKEALSAGMSPSIGHDFEEDREARFIKEYRVPCPTGIRELDDPTVLAGGLGRGEIGVVVANTGVGKSHFLVQLGAQALKSGKNVLHYTFELTETAVGRRYDSFLCDIDSNHVFDKKEEILKKYEDMDLGRLIIKEYPTGSASVVTIRNHLDRLLLKGFTPGMIIIDYADIMRSTRKFEALRLELKLIYEEIRNLASEKNIPVWTASQANRMSAQSDVVGLENMSEAYGKAMVADVVISLSRKAVEKAGGHGRLFIAKNRAGRDGILWPIHIDTARSKIRILTDAEIESLHAEEKNFETNMKDLLKKKWKEVRSDDALKPKEDE